MTLRDNENGEPELPVKEAWRKLVEVASPPPNSQRPRPVGARPVNNNAGGQRRPANPKEMAAVTGLAVGVYGIQYLFRLFGIVVAIIVIGGIISVVGHVAHGSSGWKTMSCAQFLHETPAQQQNIAAQAKSTFDYYNPGMTWTINYFYNECQYSGTATLLSIVQQ